MIIKFVSATILSIVLFIPFCCLGEEADEFRQAELYNKKKEYTNAELIYKLIVTNNPGTKSAFTAQKELVIVNILMGNDSEAEMALGKLKNDFMDDSNLPEALELIAKRYRWEKRFTESKRLYQEIIQNYPNTSPGDRSRLEILRVDIFSALESGDYAVAQTIVDSLLTNFPAHPHLPLILYETARRYESLDKFNEGKRIYQQIVDKYPGTTDAVRAMIEINKTDAIIYMQSGNHTAAQTEIDKIIVNYPNHWSTPWVLHRLAKEYIGRADQLEINDTNEQAKIYLQEAIDISEKIVNNLPQSSATPNAHSSIGDIYRRLGEYQKSLIYYQKIVDEYPNFDQAWNVLFMIGRNYNNLKEKGIISAEEANEKTHAVYALLLNKYPDCKAAASAKEWIEHHK
ncbi:MAG: hypothetical protein A2Y10_00060 [Planctomycetes bacterium GWF2_41_51]|nr:MAG: hypothetical protein A2Y10_00060 [Planctomycetes bacterium GWF2_41_51]HBG28634.1 hypothetical protein [Phycisphaerales bacterium]